MRIFIYLGSMLTVIISIELALYIWAMVCLFLCFKNLTGALKLTSTEWKVGGMPTSFSEYAYETLLNPQQQ